MANDSIDTGKQNWRLVMFRPMRKSRIFEGNEGNSSTERA